MSAVQASQTRIKTDRLLVRPPQRSDYEAWRDLREASRGHLEPWEPRWPKDALSREDWNRRLRAWRAGWRQDRAYVFLIFISQTSEAMIGGASITHVRRGAAQSGALGYWLDEAAQGKGYMSEAVGAICNWCFDTLMLDRLEAATLPHNERSRDVLLRNDFREEGFARAYLEIDGERRDHQLFARLSTRWQR